uniref:Uncharacterized protein n=1 Tax=Anguilla anguilla TaxID=7936 RepID=A0A0E9R9J7_ANGAN
MCYLSKEGNLVNCLFTRTLHTPTVSIDVRKQCESNYLCVACLKLHDKRIDSWQLLAKLLRLVHLEV